MAYVQLVTVHQPGFRMQRAQLMIRQRTVRMLFVHRVASAKSNLVQTAAAPHLDPKAARRNLRVEWPVVSARNVVKYLAAISDQPREDIKPPGRALGVRDRGDRLGELYIFLQLDHIAAALLKDGPVSLQADQLRLQLLKLLLDGLMPSGQEARPHAVSFRAKPQVEACRLKLTLVELGRPQRMPVDQLPDLLPREQAARPGELRRARQRGAGRVLRTYGHESRGREHVHAANYSLPGGGQSRHHPFSPLSRNTRQASATRASALISVSPAKAWARTGNHAGHRIIADKNRIVSVPSARPAVK